MAHRNWLATTVSFVVGLMAIGAAPAGAGQIIYDQPATSPVVSSRSSQFLSDTASFGFNTFDNFTLTQGQEISDVHWQGSYFNTLTPTVAPPNNATAFGVEFFSSDAGAPDAALITFIYSLSAVHETFVGSQVAPNLGVTLSIYNYFVDLPIAFQAQAGVEYWLHIYAIEPSPTATEAQWGWNGGSGGDGLARQAAPGGVSPTSVVAGDRAFALSIPEPATVVLMLAGLAGLAATRRRSR